MFMSLQAIHHDTATSIEGCSLVFPENKTNIINNNKTHVSTFTGYQVTHIIYIVFKILLTTSRHF